MSEPAGPSRINLWRQAQNGTGPSGGLAPRKRRHLYTAFALLLALLGATAAWLLFPSRLHEPSFLGAWIDQYDDPLVPPNAWAAQDRKALKELPWHHINAFSSQELRLLRQVLNDLRKSPPEQPVVVFLCAYAVTRSDGAVCLLPGDARVADQTTWLPLTDVLGYLQACRARHKLLVLDLMRPFTRPRLGILVEDVPARAQAAVEAAVRQDPQLQVLWACAPGQQSLVSEDLGHSVFAYYLHEGLKGRADGYGSTRDGRVSVQELARFVQARVDRWSAQTGQTRQTPQFLIGKDDFALVPVPDQLPAAPEPAAAPAYPEWLKAKWQLRDAWWQEPWGRVEPALLTALETTLLRAERRLKAGAPPATVQAAVEEQVRGLDKERAQWQAGQPTPRVASLAREIVRGKRPPDLKADDVLRKYRALLALAAKVRGDAKPRDKDKERLENDKAAVLKQFADKPFDLAWLALEELARELEPAQDRIRFVSELLAAAEQVPAYEEVGFVQRLAEWKPEAKDWPGPAVHEALQLAKKAARATAGADDPRVLPWVKPLLETARAKRQAAEQLLFNPGEATQEDVKAALTEGLRLWQAVTDQIDALTRAYRLRDDTLVRLPGYVPYLESVPEEEARRWEQAVEKTRELVGLLGARPAGPDVAAAVKKIGKVAGTLREELMNPLERQVRARFDALMERSGKAEAADWLSMSALLRLPWLEAGDRARLGTAARQLSGGLTGKVLAQDRQEDAARRQTPAPPPVDVAAVPERQSRQALLRARAALALLRLRGATDIKGAAAALSRAEREPASAEAWRALSQELRQAWGKAAPP